MKGARLSSFLPGPGCRRKYANAAVCRRAGVIYVVLAGQGSSRSTGEVGDVCLHACGCRCVRLCTWRLKGEFKILEGGGEYHHNSRFCVYSITRAGGVSL